MNAPDARRFRQMKHPVYRLLLFFVCGIAACTGANTRVEINEYPPVASCRFYRWMEPECPPADSPTGTAPSSDRLRRRAAQLLEKRGYALSPANRTPDLLIALDVLRTRRTHDLQPVARMPAGVQHEGIGGSVGFWNRQWDVDELVMTLDIIHSRSGALVWRGTGTAAVSRPENPETAPDLLERILDALPPSNPSATCLSIPGG